jgi:hypothetical protein
MSFTIPDRYDNCHHAYPGADPRVQHHSVNQKRTKILSRRILLFKVFPAWTPRL